MMCFFLSFCNSKTNIFNYTTSFSQKDQFYVHLDLAQFFYDQDDFLSAVEHAEKAYSFDSSSEEAALSYSSAYLALAGLTPIGLLEKMLDSSQKKDDGVKSEGEDTAKKDDPFKQIASLLGISDSDYLLLGRIDDSDPTLPTIDPLCANEARSRLNILTYVNKAIRASCPLVRDEVRIADEPRHQCAAHTKFIINTNKAHMFWAFAHLIEAIIFNQVISYKTTDQGKSNLELKVEKIQKYEVGNDPAQVADFVKVMADMKNSIEKVMPTSGACSEKDPQTQLIALLNDMAAVSLALESISGIPDEIKKSLLDATASLRELKQKSSTLNSGEQASATRQQLNKTISDNLLKKINSLDATHFSPEQINSICNSYASISGDSLSIPEICK